MYHFCLTYHGLFHYNNYPFTIFNALNFDCIWPWPLILPWHTVTSRSCSHPWTLTAIFRSGTCMTCCYQRHLSPPHSPSSKMDLDFCCHAKFWLCRFYLDQLPPPWKHQSGREKEEDHFNETVWNRVELQSFFSIFKHWRGENNE